MKEKESLANTPLVLQRWDIAISVAVCVGMVAGLASSIPYVFSHDSVVRAAIYSITGKVFWINFFVAFGLAGAVAISFYMLEICLKGKAYLYLKKDKIETLKRLYADSVTAQRDRFIINVFTWLVLLFATSFGLEMGLGVLKSFILR